jgi:hypothetical protein
MKRIALLVVGVFVISFLGCGGGGGDGNSIIAKYVGTWQGLVNGYSFEWRLILGDGGVDLDGNPQYSYEVWDLEDEATLGHGFLWGRGYALAFPTGLVDFTAHHPTSGALTFRFTGYINGNKMTGEMWSFLNSSSSQFNFSKK